MKKKEIHSHNRGEIAVLKVELEANLKGYWVSYPRNQHIRYDAIIDIGDKLYRTQIKYLNRIGQNGRKDLKTDCLSLLLSRRNKNKSYEAKDVDLLLVYIPKLDVILAFYPKFFNGKETIWINLQDKSSPTYYKKFLW
jgi:hypothetical protein